MRNQQEYERETQLMRQRLTESMTSQAEEDYSRRANTTDYSLNRSVNSGAGQSPPPMASHPPRRAKQDGNQHGPVGNTQQTSMRNRRAATPTSVSSSPSISTNTSNLSSNRNVHFAAPSPQVEEVDRRFSSSKQPSLQSTPIPVPASLSSTESDIQDVIHALGVNPQRMGLPPRPPAQTINRYDNSMYSSLYDADDSHQPQSANTSTNPAVNDLLQRLQGLAQVLPASPSTILNNSSSSSSNNDSHNLSNQSNILDISSSSASSGPSLSHALNANRPVNAMDSDPSQVERRLQELVSAALLSPTRPTY